VRLVTVATGLDQPVDVAGIPGTAKLAVVEKSGRVLVLTDGHPAKKPLLLATLDLRHFAFVNAPCLLSRSIGNSRFWLPTYAY